MLDKWLKQQKVLVCAGTGGVGKTTVAAALALRASQLGLKVLVLTIDPARRLADALGLNQNIDDPILVKEEPGGGQLYACMLNPERVFDQFVARHAVRPDSLSKLLRSRLYQQLKSSLSGSQEFTAMEKLRTFVDSGEYDLVILDTPPAQHAMDFLTAPLKLNALFQSTIIHWFSQGIVGRGGILKTFFQRSTVVVMKALEKLTGASFVQELSEFFLGIGDWQDLLAQRTRRVHELLTSAETQFVLVTSFDHAKIIESLDFCRDLQNRGYHLGLAIINRSFPEWMSVGNGGGALPAEVGLYYQQLKKYYRENERAYDELEHRLGSAVHILRIPDFNQDVSDLGDLETVVQSIYQPKPTQDRHGEKMGI